MRDELETCHRYRGQDSALGSSQIAKQRSRRRTRNSTATSLLLQIGNATNAFHSVLPVEESYYLSPYVKTLSFLGIYLHRKAFARTLPPHAESSIIVSSVLAVPPYEVDVRY